MKRITITDEAVEAAVLKTICATSTGVREAIATCLVHDNGDAVMFAPNTGPANGLAAARYFASEQWLPGLPPRLAAPDRRVR